MPINIYTDGSCINNGKKNAYGAIGVFYGNNDERNCGMAINDGKITNQTMELLACLEALSNIETNEIIYLYTDSQYVIKSMTEWVKKWESNNWLGANKKPIENLDIIQSLNNLLKTKKVIFKHIRSHQNPPEDENSNEYKHWFGNKMADELATKANHEYIESLKKKDKEQKIDKAKTLLNQYSIANEDELLDLVDKFDNLNKKKVVKKKKLVIDELQLEKNI